ncbi:hypothetical protein ACSBR1_008401 [Camellia fascicularis]
MSSFVSSHVGFQASAEALGLLAVKAIVAITAIIAGGRLVELDIAPYRRWKHVNEEVTAPMFQHLTDQFHMQSTNVSKVVATKCGRSLSTHTYRFRIKYLNFKSAKGEEYARSHPPPECDLEKWKNLIDKKWNDSNWLDNIIKIRDEHYSQPSMVPITLEELSVKVLKRRLGYVKGVRLRPFSVRTTSASTNSDYVSRLEMEIRAKRGNSITKRRNYSTET